MKLITLVVALLLVTPLRAEDWPSGPPSRHGRPGGFYFTPQVRDLAISPDGRWLAAAYYRPPMHRTQRDWSTWVAVWDLTTGQRTMLPNASAPIALSSDGQWLAARLYDRTQPDGSRRTQIEATHALWKPGEVQPTRMLAGPGAGPEAVITTVFGTDSKEFFGATGDGRVLVWSLADDAEGRELHRVTVPDHELTGLGGASWLPRLYARRDSLELFAPLYLRGGVPGSPTGVHVLWRKNRIGWDQPSTRFMWFPDSGRERGIPFPFYGSHYGSPSYTTSMPPHFVDLTMQPTWTSDARHRNYRGPHVAFAPEQKLQAATVGALAVLQKEDGSIVFRVPAAAVHAFTPDGRQLITSDRRGILRFWGVTSGRIERSLRLDDLPAETVVVAALQTASEFGRPEANREALSLRVTQAASAGAQIIVLPEAAITGYLTPDIRSTWQVGGRPLSAGLAGVDPVDAAETVPGVSTRFFADLAREHGVYLTVPLVEVDKKTGFYYNTVVLLGPDGEELLHYRKLNPWQWAEQGWVTTGDRGRPFVDTPLGRLGCLICFDIHEQAAEMARLKIDTLLYSVAWVEEPQSDWFAARLPEIARTSGFHIIAANWTLPTDTPAPEWFGYGQSCIIASTGEVLARAKHNIGDAFVFAELPLPAVQLDPAADDRAAP